jgi:pilus assembly protein Flp/PilA
MKKIQAMLHRLYRDEEGATAVEYGVLVALIIAACVAIIAVLGGQINDAFQAVSDELGAVGS